MQYAHLHEYNPDKYPATRVPIEMREFLKNILELMKAFFGGNDSVLGKIFIFFVDNPVLMFLVSFGLMYGAFNIVRYSLKVTKM